VALLIGAVCGAGATAARLTVRDAEEIRELAERRATVTATLVVRDDPRPVRGAGGRPPTVLVAAELVRLEQADGPAVTTAARVLVLAGDPSWRQLLPGQRLVATGRLAAPRGGDLTAAVLSAAGPPKLIGRPSWAQRAAGFLRAGLQSACAPLPDEPGGLLPGLVVGDTSQLPASVAEDFRATGMTHLVAVSGANVG
jgi:competence protein ComEC